MMRWTDRFPNGNLLNKMNFIQEYIREAWLMTAEMAPYLLLGFAIAGILHKFIKKSWIETTLGKRGSRSIIMASLVGVPMPLCSCGVIPVTASIRDKGASKGATTSFLTSTPQTGVDSILATLGMLGPVFAFYRVIVAFISGIVVGTTVELLSKDDSGETPTAKSTEKPISWKAGIRYGFVELPQDIAGSLTFGLLLAALIAALAPENMLANLPGGVWTSIILTTFVATPLYICSTGSIPLAVALVHSGLPVSAALVLLIAGPATNIATIATMRKVIGGRATGIYLTCIIIISWVAAFIFHLFFEQSAPISDHLHQEGGYELIKMISGIALIAMLAWARWGYKIQARESHDHCQDCGCAGEKTDQLTLQIEGMTCNHCRKSVQDGLESCNLAAKVTVDLKAGEAKVQGTNLVEQNYIDKVTSLGFEVTNTSLQKA